MKYTITALVVVVILTAGLVQSASASPPMFLHMEAREFIGEPNTVPFTASGRAVSEGLICSEGEVTDTENFPSEPKGNLVNIEAVKVFDCGDGTFTVNLSIRLNLTTRRTSATWEIVDSTGNYAGINGNGSLYGIPVIAGLSIDDFYNGIVY